MSWTTVDNVAELVGLTSDWDQLEPWMAAANALVDARLVNSGLPAALKARIADHLSAHFFELSGAAGSGGRIATSESLGSWSISYATSAAGASQLQSTRNGRIACELDVSGLLAETSKPKHTFSVM